MPHPTTPAWGLRLADVLGGRLDQISEEHLQRLVAGRVREDADLDFKRERYGNSDAEKRELAADIASMANHRGGLIIIGVREENEVAVELTPVSLDAGEELRLTQTAAGNIAPHLTFAVEVAQSASESSRGYYLLTVPPSTLRPHAVRSGRNLGFPVRDGPTKRWLSESELADAYRDRYRLATDQVSRATHILTEGLEMMDRESGALLGLAMVPTGQGSMAIDLARVRAFEQWIRDLGAAVRFDGFFDPAGSPTGSVAAHRVTMNPLWDSNSPGSTGPCNTLTRRSCDGSAQAKVRSGCSSGEALARAAVGGASRAAPAVLGRDRLGCVQRGRGRRGRGVSCGWRPVVSRGWWDAYCHPGPVVGALPVIR